MRPRVSPLGDAATQVNMFRTKARANTQAQIAAADGDATELSPWVQRTGWSQLLAGQQRPQLLELNQPPAARSESYEGIIWTAVHEMAQLCEKSMQTDGGHFILTEIMQTEPYQGAKRTLQPYQCENLARFARPWQEIMMFFLRTTSREAAIGPVYHLTPTQSGMLAALRTTVAVLKPPSCPVQTAELKFSSIHQHCLQFCLALLDHSVRTTEYESPFLCALAVVGVSEHGFKSPQEFTSSSQP